MECLFFEMAGLSRRLEKYIRQIRICDGYRLRCFYACLFALVEREGGNTIVKLFFRCGRQRTATCTGVRTKGKKKKRTHYQNSGLKALPQLQCIEPLCVCSLQRQTHLPNAPASTRAAQKKP